MDYGQTTDLKKIFRVLGCDSGSAAVVEEMLLDLLRLIYQAQHWPCAKAARRGQEVRGNPQLMFIAMYIAAATARQTPVHATQIARDLLIPRGTVRRHLATLRIAGRVNRIGNRYVGVSVIPAATADAMIERVLATADQLRAIKPERSLKLKT